MTPYRGGPPGFPPAPLEPSRWARGFSVILLLPALLLLSDAGGLGEIAQPWLSLLSVVAVATLVWGLHRVKRDARADGNGTQHREWLKALGPPDTFPGHRPCDECPSPTGQRSHIIRRDAKQLLVEHADGSRELVDESDGSIVRVVDACARATGQRVASPAEAHQDWDELLEGMRQRDENERPVGNGGKGSQ